jgi:hypothetical protein
MNSTYLRTSAWLGVIFGIFLMFGETRRNWGDWGHWTSYTFDYLFAAMLVLFGYLSLQRRAYARVLLMLTWVLTIALFTYSFTGHMRHLDGPTNGPIPHLELTIWIGSLDVIAFVALVAGLISFFSKGADSGSRRVA